MLHYATVLRKARSTGCENDTSGKTIYSRCFCEQANVWNSPTCPTCLTNADWHLAICRSRENRKISHFAAQATPQLRIRRGNSPQNGLKTPIFEEKMLLPLVRTPLVGKEKSVV